jgi:YHS domain-containing protein
MVVCHLCGEEIAGEHEDYTVTLEGKTYHYCSHEHLSTSETLKRLTQGSLSGLVLNKTFFEVFALVTGLGGVYYTLWPTEPRALLMDTVSVISALAALVIGVEHLRYVEEHRLLRRAITFLSVIILLSFALVVWTFGLR